MTKKQKFKINFTKWRVQNSLITHDDQGMPCDAVLQDRCPFEYGTKAQISNPNKLNIQAIEKNLLGSLLKSWRYSKAGLQFAYKKSGNIDHRMDLTSQTTAMKWVESEGIKLTRRTYDRLENAQTRVNSENAKKIRKLLGCSFPSHYELVDKRSIESVIQKYMKGQADSILFMPDFVIDVLVVFDNFFNEFIQFLSLSREYKGCYILENDKASKKNRITKNKDKLTNIKVSTELMMNAMYKTAMKYIWLYNGEKIFINESGDDYSDDISVLNSKDVWEKEGLFVRSEIGFEENTLGSVTYKIFKDYLEFKGESDSREAMLLFCLDLMILIQNKTQYLLQYNILFNSDSYSSVIESISNIEMDFFKSNESASNMEGLLHCSDRLNITESIAHIFTNISFIKKYHLLPEQIFVNSPEVISRLGESIDIDYRFEKDNILNYTKEKHKNAILKKYSYQYAMNNSVDLLILMLWLNSRRELIVSYDELYNVTKIYLHPKLSDYVIVKADKVLLPNKFESIASINCEEYSTGLYYLAMAKAKSQVLLNSYGGYYLVISCSKYYQGKYLKNGEISIGTYSNDGGEKIFDSGHVVEADKDLRSLAYKPEYFPDITTDVLSGNVLKDIKELEDINLEGFDLDFLRNESKEEIINYIYLMSSILFISIGEAAEYLLVAMRKAGISIEEFDDEIGIENMLLMRIRMYEESRADRVLKYNDEFNNTINSIMSSMNRNSNKSYKISKSVNNRDLCELQEMSKLKHN